MTLLHGESFLQNLTAIQHLSSYSSLLNTRRLPLCWFRANDDSGAGMVEYSVYLSWPSTPTCCPDLCG
jgi:hypothetical protein